MTPASGPFGTTGGPWAVGVFGISGSVFGPDDVTICSVPKPDFTHDGVDAANLRAIAQVPAMLALVDEVSRIPLVRLCNGMGIPIEGTENKADAIINAARAIVAKLSEEK